MFNFKFQLILICGLFTFLLMVCWPTSILACSSRSIIKPRPVAIEAPTTSTTSIPIKSNTKISASISLPKRAPKYGGATTTIIALSPTVKSLASTKTTTTSTSTTTTSTTTTTLRPNITFPTFKCPANYDAWYCLNEASCFTVKIGDSIMYNCECATGFMGPRCEYKEFDGSFQPKRPRPILEKASIASGVACILLFLLFICLVIYLRYDQKYYEHQSQQHRYHHFNKNHNYDDCNNKENHLNVSYEKCIYCLKLIQLNDNSKHSMACHFRYPLIEAFPIGAFIIKRFHKV